MEDIYIKFRETVTVVFSNGNVRAIFQKCPKYTLDNFEIPKAGVIINLNIARVLALSESYLIAVIKFFIYARPCLYKMTSVMFIRLGF